MGHMAVTRIAGKRRTSSAKNQSQAMRVLPFAVGAAVGITAGAVAGVLLEQEIGRAVGHVMGVVDRRGGKAEEPRFDLLLQ